MFKHQNHAILNNVGLRGRKQLRFPNGFSLLEVKSQFVQRSYFSPYVFLGKPPASRKLFWASLKKIQETNIKKMVSESSSTVEATVDSQTIKVTMQLVHLTIQPYSSWFPIRIQHIFHLSSHFWLVSRMSCSDLTRDWHLASCLRQFAWLGPEMARWSVVARQTKHWYRQCKESEDRSCWPRTSLSIAQCADQLQSR